MQRSWECKGQICNLNPTRSRCSKVLTSKDFIELLQVAAEKSCDKFLSHDKYHTYLITAKECTRKNKVHVVKTYYTVVFMVVWNFTIC